MPALWDMLNLQAGAMALGGALGAAKGAGGGFTKLAIAGALGAGVGFACAVAAWAAGRYVVRKIDARNVSPKTEWKFRAAYTAAVLWIPCSGFLGFGIAWSALHWFVP
jgi:hypothetical protein